MDTNNNTQLTNTFLKGMNTDISDMLIEDSEYRLAENLRYVTNTESNTGELRLIEGDIPCRLMLKNGNQYVDITNTTMVVAATSIRDIIILVINTSDGWNIVKGTLGGTDINLTTVFGPCEELLSTNKLSLVTRWEDNDNVKLYIADGKHPLMVVNIADNGPISSDIASITNIKNIILLPLSIDYDIVGSLKPSLVLYSYRLYNKNGISTNMSPVTELYKIQDYKNGYTYGYKQGTSSNKGLSISGIIEEDFETLQLYRITYESKESEPTIELIYQGHYDNNFTYLDKGTKSLSTLTLAEYNSIAGINIIPSVIESKNDYLFAANIKYESYIYDEDILNWDARCYSLGDYYIDNNIQINCLAHLNEIPTDVDIKNDNLLSMTLLYDITKWIYEDGGVYYIGGVGKHISYKFKTELETLDTDAVDAQKKGINKENTSSKRYNSLWRDEVYRYGIVLYDNNGTQYPVKWIMDVRTPAQRTDYSSYNTIINNGEVGKFTDLNYIDEEYLLKSNILGIEFHINDLPTNVISYDIVRCNRTVEDKHIICQGVISSTVEHDSIICSTGLITTHHVEYIDDNEDYNQSSPATISESDINVLLFFSPEISYLLDDIINILSVNKNKLKVLKRILAIYNGDGENSKMNITSPVNYHDYNTDYNNINSCNFYSYNYDLNKQTVSENNINYYKITPKVSIKEYLSNATGQYDAVKGARKYLNPHLTYCKPYIDLFYNTTHYSVIEEPTVSIEEITSKFDYEVDTFTKVDNLPNWNEFATSDTSPSLTFRDDVVSINGYTFYKWSVPFFVNQIIQDNNIISAFDSDAGKDRVMWTTPTGITDTSLLLQLEDIKDEQTSGMILFEYRHKKATDSYISRQYITQVCNLYKDVVPYGGYTNYARTNSIYYSYGNHHKASETTCDVFDGDCFIKIFECTPLHTWYNAKLKYHLNNCVVYAIPIETSIDLDATYGTTYTRAFKNTNSGKLAACVLNLPANVDDRFTLTTPMYVYNEAYSSDSYTKSFTGIEEEYLKDNEYDYRIYYSLLKTNNEPIDNWTIFKSADYLDVDTRYGLITDLRLFNNQLLYWLDNAFGILSVNERTLLQDINDTNIMLGTGDVLLRYDHISTEYGMRPNQYADVQSNTTLYWWDGYKKELLAYGGGNSGVLPLSKVKNVRNYINERDEISHPTLAYDYKYNEIMFNVVNDGALTYNENIQAFTSVYPETLFYDKVLLRDNLLLIDESGVYKWNETNKSGAMSFNKVVHPMLKYVVNKASTEVKVFDNVRFGGRFYGGDFLDDENVDDLKKLKFKFDTPLKQHSELEGKDITNREYDFRFAIPRHNGSEYGGRMRGKTMQCELSSDSNSLDFSLQYITTKFRISWS